MRNSLNPSGDDAAHDTGIAPVVDREVMSSNAGSRQIGVVSHPITNRGRRTRERLLDAAAVVFERDGYLNAKITDFTAGAGVSNGSFYTYFESKEAIFSTVISEVNERMFLAASPPRLEGQSPADRIEQVTRAYVRAYRENAGLVGILEQVATFNQEFREMRRAIRQTFRNRTEKGLRRLQAEGLIDQQLSPRCAAEALTSMVSNFCYVSMVLGEEYDEDEVVRTLTSLWVRGIGLVQASGAESSEQADIPATRSGDGSASRLRQRRQR